MCLAVKELFPYRVSEAPAEVREHGSHNKDRLELSSCSWGEGHTPSCDQQAVPRGSGPASPSLKPRALCTPLPQGCPRARPLAPPGQPCPATRLRCPPEPTGPPQPVHAAGNPVFFTRAWRRRNTVGSVCQGKRETRPRELQEPAEKAQIRRDGDALLSVGRNLDAGKMPVLCQTDLQTQRGLSK